MPAFIILLVDPDLPEGSVLEHDHKFYPKVVPPSPESVFIWWLSFWHSKVLESHSCGHLLKTTIPGECIFRVIGDDVPDAFFFLLLLFGIRLRIPLSIWGGEIILIAVLSKKLAASGKGK